MVFSSSDQGNTTVMIETDRELKISALNLEKFEIFCSPDVFCPEKNKLQNHKMIQSREVIPEKILVLDGAMGTMIQSRKLTENDFRGSHFKNHNCSLSGLNDILVLTRPDIVAEIHTEYLEAGADIITTNTFNAHHMGLKEYELESVVYDINYKAVQLARSSADHYTSRNPDKPRYVAGTIGPTGKMASLSPDLENPAYRDIDFDTLAWHYQKQARALVDGGADILLVETVFDTLNAKAALYAINKVRQENAISIPVMVSATIDENGRTLSGQTVEALYNALYPFSLFSIGLNCSFGADSMLPYLERLSVKAQIPVSVHPNAGLPDEFGKYSQSATEMAGHLEQFCKKGLVNIIGGCCGTGPEHTAAMSELARTYSPRPVKTRSRTTRFSGLQSFGVKNKTPIVKIGEKTNVPGSQSFARLIKNERYEEALQIARQQIRDGCDMLNINVDDGMIDSPSVVEQFLNYLQSEPDIVNVPVFIDSSDFTVIERGLKCLQGRSGVNSISLKDGEEVFRKKAETVRQMGAVIMVMAFDEQGQAECYDRKTQICERAYRILTEELEFPPEDIIFDPNVLAVGTGIDGHNHFAVDFIEAAKWIKEHLPFARVNAGVGNISFAFKGNRYLRNVMDSVFYRFCEKAGVDFAIIDPSRLMQPSEIPDDLYNAMEDLLLNKTSDATDRVVELANHYESTNVTRTFREDWRKLPAEQRLTYAVRNGISSFIEEDVKALQQQNEQMQDIIHGPLLDSMNQVGELYGEGNIFLPQVIKSVRIINQAVDCLKRDIETVRPLVDTSSPKRKKVLLATVEGDVHDIGKNIVSLVLRCNDYDVIDLGVMVPAEDIVDAIKTEQPDVIGLSGLITPSLKRMISVLKELNKHDIQIPVMMGGAATSPLHTAIKAAPHYRGPVMQVKDAMHCIRASNGLLGEKASSFVKKLKKRQRQLREEYRKKKVAAKFLPLDKARKRRFDFKKNKAEKKPNVLGVKELNNFDIKEVIKYIDWTPFFRGWGLKGKYPSIFEKERVGIEAERLYKEALEILDEIDKKNLASPKGVIGIFPANSEGDDILIYKDDKRDELIMRIPMLRQQFARGGQDFTLSLADYVAPHDSGIKSYFGGFAVTTGSELEDHLEDLKDSGDSYNSIMFRLIADRLVEATAEIMHEWVRKKYWGYAPQEQLSKEECIKGKYCGIRPAVGYPACPDHRTELYLFDLLQVEKNIGVTLTQSYAMKPASSVSGFYLSHEASRYFGIGKIGKDQLEDYARRMNQNVKITQKRLYFALAEGM